MGLYEIYYSKERYLGYTLNSLQSIFCSRRCLDDADQMHLYIGVL